jgi:hypothetical protein
MTKFQVIVTRDITESTFIDVEAASAEEAEELALRQLYEQGETIWEVDDCPARDAPYVTDASPIED